MSILKYEEGWIDKTLPTFGHTVAKEQVFERQEHNQRNTRQRSKANHNLIASDLHQFLAHQYLS
jgi:hypothetical protein